MDKLAQISIALLPLYGVILIAWAIGDRLPWAAKLFSRVLVYGLIPLLVIDKVLGAEMSQLLVIPPMVFAISALMSLPANWLAKRLGNAFEPRLMSASFSFFNVAFFGVPLAKALFGEAGVSTMICAYIGSALYGNTIGYFLIARTKEGAAQAATKALKVPLFYVVVASMALKLQGVSMPESAAPIVSLAGTLVSVLGMAVIGLNLTGTTRTDWQAGVIGKILLTRQVSAVVLFAAALALEGLFVGVLSPRDRALVGLVALFPIASNVTLFATLLETNRKSAAILVAVSSVVALILVALAVCLFGSPGSS
ncbi:AEC family transporter [Sphingomonas faeni]|uniref:AEC family transporter n=1 Tax=Sphingomonas faeni TaxID=185950 RepID=UPI0024139052|nr:AEC family transporter [Sphingomonas faeni]